MLYYLYNGDELLGFIYNGNTYYYHKNVFGDIIGILDSSYNEIVTYEYDSWGVISNIVDTSGINLSIINPFRFRSYYYDEETGLYYLNSRYYNPIWGRFSNSDSIITGQGHNGNNIFVYCLNNPIKFADKEGNIVILAGLLLCAGIGGLVSAGGQIMYNKSVGKNYWWDGVNKSFWMGAITGALMYGVPSLCMQVVIGTTIVSESLSVYNGEKEPLEAVISGSSNILINYGSNKLANVIVNKYNLSIPAGLSNNSTTNQRIAAVFFDSYSGTTISSSIGYSVSNSFIKPQYSQNKYIDRRTAFLLSPGLKSARDYMLYFQVCKIEKIIWDAMNRFTLIKN